MRWIVCLCLVLLGCGDPVTQVILVVDSDLTVPGELADVKITITGPAMGMGENVYGDPDLGDANPLQIPVTLGIVPLLDDLEPLNVRVIGGPGNIVVRSAETAFVRDESRVLFLPLVRTCMSIECGFGMTCIDGACQSEAVPAETMPVYDGQIPRL